jgi:hypothetical protein
LIAVFADHHHYNFIFIIFEICDVGTLRMSRHKGRKIRYTEVRQLARRIVKQRREAITAEPGEIITLASRYRPAAGARGTVA